MSTHKHSGFTLVELAISLVIIGIILGGVLSVRNLINQSKSAGIISDISSYKSAIANFRDRYASLPGDMPDASDYWVAASNGNANNSIGGLSSPSSERGERLGFWEHLSKAGYIEGAFTGPASASSFLGALGTQIPESPINNAGYYALSVPRLTANSNIFWLGQSHLAVTVGLVNTATGLTSNGAMSGVDADKIDRKMDDGLPGKGIVRAARNASTNCATNITNPDTAEYDLSPASASDCALYFNMSQ